MANTKISALPSGNPAQAGDLVPIDRAGANFSITVGSVASLAPNVPTLGTPTYFFPNQFIFDNYDPVNIDPRATASSVNLVASWKYFFLPFNITVTRYRFQVDTTGTAATFYSGIYTAAGSLIFDIGAVSLTASGQYGKGAVHDPGTNLFDSNGVASNAITLNAGWYIYGWGASASSGANTMVFPSMASLNTTLFNEEINVDTVGLPTGIVARWGAASTATIAGGHMPPTLGTAQSGVPTNPPNITFFA
jgi:hypothetical protein